MNRPDLAILDEPSLIRQFLARRDEASFREIYRRQTPLLYRIAVRLSRGSNIRADDVVQEAWLRAITALPRFLGDSSLRTWLVAIVLNVMREMRRPRADVIPFESLGDDPVALDADPAVIAERDLTPQLLKLPEGYRTVLVLHDLEGLTHQEIAQALDITSGTAKSQLSRARAAIRSLLDPQPEGSARRLP